MSVEEVDVECPKCKCQTKMIKGQEMWHQRCPSRGPREAAPKYVVVRKESAPCR